MKVDIKDAFSQMIRFCPVKAKACGFRIGDHCVIEEAHIDHLVSCRIEKIIKSKKKTAVES